jgi:hypothetical protein
MCDTEVYTVRVDSTYASSNTSFVGYINIPLRNVVKVELLSCSLHGNATAPVTTNAFYVQIEELISKFNDRTNLAYDSRVAGQISSEGVGSSAQVSNSYQLATSLVCIPVSDGTSEHRTNFTVGNYFPVETSFIEPIRQIEKLTVNIFLASGAQPNITGGPTFLTLRFTCSKPNVCQYGGQIV